MTPKERVMTALHGKQPDKVPFTVYECMIPQCTIERELRNQGLCIVHRMASYKTIYPNVTVKSYGCLDEKNRKVIRTVYSTPYGDMSNLVEPAGFTSWTHEHLFKSEEDYKKLLFIIKDCIAVPDYDAVAQKVKMLGGDFVVRDQLLSEPLQSLISEYMGTETFCYEWMDNRDQILELYDALLENSRKVFQIVANGPLEFANLGGNVVPNIIGAETFRKYYVPVYNEAAELLHKKSKLIGCHFDADNSIIMDDIGNTLLDYIEAYDAGISPSIKEAREKWPNKVLWLNWPSSWHLLDDNQIYNKTKLLLDEASPCNGFLIGITEDVPQDRWQSNFRIIMTSIDSHK
jgi:hypothetical protein